MKYCEEVGCTMKKKKSEDDKDRLFVALKGPLVFKAPSNKRPKKN